MFDMAQDIGGYWQSPWDSSHPTGTGRLSPKVLGLQGALCFGIMPLYQYLLASCFASFWLCSSLPIAVMEPLPSHSSGLAYASCNCTSVHICASSCVVWLICTLEGVAQCVSLHPARLLCGQVSRGKECEYTFFNMKNYVSFFSFSQIPCVFQFFWHYGLLLWSICDWLTKWAQVKSVLISKSDWTLDPF